MDNTIRIGTRESRLAIIQAELVAAAIRQAEPSREIRLVPVKTTGDRIQHMTLDKIGGKGLFVKELDEALRRGEVDLCVHSCKDLPAELPDDLPIVAVSPREDPRDVLILPADADELVSGAPIGCSSRRRQVQIEVLYPGQPVRPIRGNVLTRLEKLDRGEYGALVLAAAGIKRLGLWDRVSRALEPDEMLPASCQGILAVQGRAGEDYGFLRRYHDPGAWDACLSERAFIGRLGCGCGAPVGVHSQISGDTLTLSGMIAHKGVIHRDSITGSRRDAVELGEKLAEIMLEGSGADWTATEKSIL